MIKLDSSLLTQIEKYLFSSIEGWITWYYVIMFICDSSSTNSVTKPVRLAYRSLADGFIKMLKMANLTCLCVEWDIAKVGNTHTH